MWLEFSVVSDCFLYQLYLPDAGGFLITPSACWISILIVSSWFRTSFTSLISVQPSCSTTSSPPPSSYMTTAVFLVSYEILAVWISQTVSRKGQNCVWKRGIISWGEFRHHYRLGAVFFFFLDVIQFFTLSENRCADGFGKREINSECQLCDALLSEKHLRKPTSFTHLIGLNKTRPRSMSCNRRRQFCD